MKALLIVDVQNDFLARGSLGIEGAHLVIPVINCLQQEFELVVATKDWHPLNHISFGTWPQHCVEGTKGADFPKELDITRIQKVIYKGSEVGIDSYSAFFDNASLQETQLRQYLQSHKVDELYVVGLATDFCVKYTALDALKLGFSVTIIEDGCRGIEKGRKALEEMKHAGACLTTSKALFKKICPLEK